MTVLEGIRKTAEFLEHKGVDSPRLQAELLLAHVLQMPRMKLYLSFEKMLSPTETDAFRELVRRRGQREPLQHILGTVSFCGLELASDRGALIPRPETEILAQMGWEFLKQCSDAPPAAFDYGTGTGCLAIALAVNCPSAIIWAADAAPEALALARANAMRHGIADRTRFLSSDGFATVPETQRFDLIISNPPYIPSAEINSLAPEVRDHDPLRALDGGADGLDFYRSIACEAGRFLKPGGKLMVEFGDGQAASAREIFNHQNWIVEAVTQDYSPRDRFLTARRS